MCLSLSLNGRQSCTCTSKAVVKLGRLVLLRPPITDTAAGPPWCSCCLGDHRNHHPRLLQRSRQASPGHQHDMCVIVTVAGLCIQRVVCCGRPLSGGAWVQAGHDARPQAICVGGELNNSQP